MVEIYSKSLVIAMVIRKNTDIVKNDMVVFLVL